MKAVLVWASGKRLFLYLLFVLTQGNGDVRLYGDIADKYSTLISTHGFNEHYLLRVCGISPANNALDNKSIVNRQTC
jgi:hypothetical protein